MERVKNMANIIDGRKLADKMQQDLQKEVATLKQAGITPGLAVILVGDNPASQVYVRNKERSAQKIGIYSLVERLPETTSEAALLERIAELNQAKEIHGILVQLPLPPHINAHKVLLAISPAKDVDGFHPVNMGYLFSGRPHIIPCTPYGIMQMLEAYHIEPAGKRAVVIGRSNIVGKPVAQLLLMADATVTVAHSKTPQLPEVAKEADILVSAVGKGNFVTADFIKPGAVVIDVGMNRDSAGKLVGDVAYAEVAPLTSYITPVPGGVGPMTITMLMVQTVAAAKKA